MRRDALNTGKPTRAAHTQTCSRVLRDVPETGSAPPHPTPHAPPGTHPSTASTPRKTPEKVGSSKVQKCWESKTRWRGLEKTLHALRASPNPTATGLLFWGAGKYS